MMNLALISDRATLAGHQTFAVRTGWLKKGIDALTVVGPDALSQDDALVTLGVGKNMVQSIRHWLLTAGMAQLEGRGLSITDLGQSLFDDESGWDPYLEDDATLWLIHWQMTAPLSPALSWVWAFHEISTAGFTKKTLVEAVLLAAQAKLAKAPGPETVSRDIDCLLHTYVSQERSEGTLDTLDCPLQTLGLIRAADAPRSGEERRYRFQIGPKPTLPPQIFYHALSRFWLFRKARATMTVQDIVYGAGGPGRAFKLDEDSVLGYLDGIADASQGGFLFDDAALTRQVVLSQPEHGCVTNPLYFLEGYYSHV